MILLLTGCSGLTSMDGFFFNPRQVASYGYAESTTIPEELLEAVDFESEDGTLLRGVWAWQERPDLAETVVHFHGNKDDLDYHFPRVDVLHSWGYNVFIFDYRGYGASEGSPDHDGVLADGRAATAYVLETLGQEDAGALRFNGVSLGGYVSLRTALEYPPAAIVTEDLFSSAENLAQDNTLLPMAGAWLFDGEWDSQEAARRLDGVPLMVVHGDSDTYVATDHARWLYAAAQEPKELWLVPGGNHGPVVDSVRHFQLLPVDYCEHLTRWWEGEALALCEEQ